MSVYSLSLVWKRDGEDVDLGTCFHTSRPIAGELLTFISDAVREHVVWKVALVYHHPFKPDSPDWTSWRRTGIEPEGMTYYWVEPAEGPWSS
jgi:hypothetical protein